MKGSVLALAILCLSNITIQEECDCLYKNYNPVCGRNGITYYSNCHRKCDNVEKAHDGWCSGERSICNCPLVIEPVCGENGITYNNSCVAQCHGQMVSKVGRCSRCNCDQYATTPVCGINGITYRNFCELSCNRGFFAYGGQCNQQINCDHCTQEWEDPLCDVNGVKYRNACYLRCNNATVDPYARCLSQSGNAQFWTTNWIK